MQSFIRNPDANLPYTTFKEGLLRATNKTLPQRVQEVMDVRLGDRRPSDLLHVMQESWPESDPEDSLVFRQLFIQKLPPSLQPGLSSYVGTLTDLALLSDTQVAALRNLGLQSSQTDGALAIGAIRSTGDSGMNEHTLELPQDVLATRQQGHWRGRQRRAEPRRSFPSHRPGEFCWYHRRWGENATKCNGMGCSFRRAENGDGAHRQFHR